VSQSSTINFLHFDPVSLTFMRLAHIALTASFAVATYVPCCAQAVVGEMFASDASVHGSVLFASGGTQIQSGSSVTSGDAAAVLKLRRGGEMKVCPKTSVSVAASPNGRDLLWGMNSGAVEAHFTLSASADTVMTPDFRILLSGPGIFDFAISADSRGDMCVRSLPQNTASVIVTEINGDGTYQVKPNVQLVFRNGSVADPSPLIPPDCGCPEPRIQVQTAEAKKPEPQPQSNPTLAATAPELPSMAPNPNLPPRPVPSEMAHLEMEAPFVYQAGNPDLELDYVAARLRLTSGAELPKASVLPPPEPKVELPALTRSVVPEAKPKEKKGFFGKVGGFFSRIFK
jgi:hypothetical protein